VRSSRDDFVTARRLIGKRCVFHDLVCDRGQETLTFACEVLESGLLDDAISIISLPPLLYGTSSVLRVR
jgi:hypothetical protein